MRNRKPGALSRPGAILEFQFPQSTDLGGRVKLSLPLRSARLIAGRRVQPRQPNSGHVESCATGACLAGGFLHAETQPPKKCVFWHLLSWVDFSGFLTPIYPREILQRVRDMRDSRNLHLMQLMGISLLSAAALHFSRQQAVGQSGHD
jgi:hypothetical protein